MNWTVYPWLIMVSGIALWLTIGTLMFAYVRATAPLDPEDPFPTWSTVGIAALAAAFMWMGAVEAFGRLQ